MTKVTSERRDGRANPAATASWSAGATAEDGGGVVTAKVSVEEEQTAAAVNRSRPAVVAERCMSAVRDSCGVARQCAARTWHRCNDTIAHAVA